MDKEDTEYMLRWSEHNPQVMAIFHQVGNISKQRKYFDHHKTFHYP